MKRMAVLAVLAFAWGIMLLPAAADAREAKEARIPLRNGRLHLSDLSAEVLGRLSINGLPLRLLDRPQGHVDLNGLRGNLLLRAMNEALGEGWTLTITDDWLIVRIDEDALPDDWRSMKSAARTFTAAAAPAATADQRRYHGLLMPAVVAPATPMVILVHGLDGGRGGWGAMAELLSAEGYQVATFAYPSDQPLADSSVFFGRYLTALHETFPELPLHVVAHSMGALVVRGHIEGSNYAGGVRRLIMTGPPNHGSRWARYRLLLEIEEHYRLWRHEPDWRPTWMITDGLGEAGRDLRPGSAFLREINARPRREGVHYTIIAGSVHPAARMTADLLHASADVLPERVSGYWGVRQAQHAAAHAADRLRQRTGQWGGPPRPPAGTEAGATDGPVKVGKARLDDVDDFVLLPVDHQALYLSINGRPPAAWEPIRERLAAP